MKNTYSLLIICLFATTIQAQNPAHLWVAEQSASGFVLTNEVFSDANDNIYITGGFSGTIDLDPGPSTASFTAVGDYDCFVTKLDNQGNYLWGKIFGGSSTDFGLSLDLDSSGNIYICGRYAGTADFDPGPGVVNETTTGINDIFILKLDPVGTYIWHHVYGSINSTSASSIKIGPNNNVHVLGVFIGTIDFDPGPGVVSLTSNGSQDPFVLQFDSAGNLNWAKHFGGILPDFPGQFALDSIGNVYINGKFQQTADFETGPGTTLISALTSNGYEGFVCKLTSNGNLSWVKHIGGPGYMDPRGIEIDKNGDVCYTGFFDNIIDFDPSGANYMMSTSNNYHTFVSKLSGNGDFIWAQQIGGNGTSTVAHDITSDANGYLYVSGYFWGTIDFDPGPGNFTLTNPTNDDPYVMQLDPNGIFKWAMHIESVGDGRANDLALNSDGSMYAVGYFKDNADFDPNGLDTITALAATDGYVQKLMDNCVLGITSTTDIQVACDSFTWIDNNTYTASNNTATHTLMNATNCDSIITLDLTITNSTSGTDIQTACESFLWIDGNTYTANNNTATHTLSNVANCDSVITLDLTITNSTSGTDTQTACESFLWIDGNTYTSSNNTASHILTNAAGCDSTVTLDLTIYTVDASISQLNDLTLQANLTGAQYQWLYCDSSFAIINGEFSQTYTALQNGNYAVQVTSNGCVDTSECVAITNVGIIENDFGNGFVVYPNPTEGLIYVSLGDQHNSIKAELIDINGKIVSIQSFNNVNSFEINIEGDSGQYILKISSQEEQAQVKIIKE